MIVNLTQHNPTPEQVEDGVYDLNSGDRSVLVSTLTFRNIPPAMAIAKRAETIAELAADIKAESAMIGGAPYLMAPLARELRARGIKPVFAFSQRKSVELQQEDGSVKKIQVFEHMGFVEAVE